MLNYIQIEATRSQVDARLHWWWDSRRGEKRRLIWPQVVLWYGKVLWYGCKFRLKTRSETSESAIIQKEMYIWSDTWLRIAEAIYFEDGLVVVETWISLRRSSIYSPFFDGQFFCIRLIIFKVTGSLHRLLISKKKRNHSGLMIGEEIPSGHVCANLALSKDSSSGLSSCSSHVVASGEEMINLSSW